MDNEAAILLDDVITFCKRDGLEARLINMLGQSRALALTDESLTVEAPSRFAYSFLIKQRATIERYLEEIAFAPLSLIVTVPQDTGEVAAASATATPVAMPAAMAAASAAATPVAMPAETPAAVPQMPAGTGSHVAAQAAPTATAGASAPTLSVSPASTSPAVAAAEATSLAYATAAVPQQHTEPAVPAPSPAAPTYSHIPTPTPFAAPADRDPATVKVNNTMSPEMFQQMMSSMKQGAGTNVPRETTDLAAAPSPEPVPAPPSAYNSKFTFETFVYGPENKHAYLSAQRFAAFAEVPGQCTSLFIYGKSGLGKTHLLFAIKNFLADQKSWIRVKYANSQTYVDDFISEVAKQKNESRAILRDYHDADVLIIDDIQNIIGKQASIEYFFSLIDEFIRENKKVVIASDRAPKDLGMDERLTSRFSSGMLCLVSIPGFEMKYQILKNYYKINLDPDRPREPADEASLMDGVRLNEGHLTDDQLKHMAEISGNNIRELESFCERCASLSHEREEEGTTLTAEDIDTVAAEYFDTAHKVISIRTVQSVVEDYYNVSHEDMIGRKRQKNIAFARHVAVYLINSMCEVKTQSMIGEAFGRDHSTVIYSIKLVETKVKEDAAFAEEMNQLRNKIMLKS